MGTLTLPPLYAIAADLSAVIERIADASGELNAETEQALDHLAGQFEDKAERLVYAIRSLEAHAEGLHSELDRLYSLYHQRKQIIGTLRSYLQRSMEQVNAQKIERTTFTARLQTNSMPSIKWTRPVEELPEAFAHHVVTLDTDKAREALESRGVLPEGFTVERGRHLRIV